MPSDKKSNNTTIVDYSKKIEGLEKEIEAFKEIKCETQNKEFQRNLEELIKDTKRNIEILESERQTQILIQDNLELFSPCPECNLARDCISYFRQKIPINRNYRKEFFKKWIEKCIKNTKVKSRQDLLSLIDEQTHCTHYDYIYGDLFEKPSYRYAVGKCLDEIINEPQSEIHLFQKNNINFYYSRRLTDDIEDTIQEKVKSVRELKRHAIDIGDCLTYIVAEYFKIFHGEIPKIKFPIESNKKGEAIGEIDIDVLTRDYMIETRNHRQPLDIVGLGLVLKKYKTWEEKGYDRKKVLICYRAFENIKRRCEEENIILIEVGVHVLPKEIWEKIRIGQFYRDEIKQTIWRRIMKVLE